MSQSPWPLLFLSINSNTKYLEIRSLGNRVGEIIQCPPYGTGMAPSSLRTWKGFLQHGTSAGSGKPYRAEAFGDPAQKGCPGEAPRAWGEHGERGGSGTRGTVIERAGEPARGHISHKRQADTVASDQATARGRTQGGLLPMCSVSVQFLSPGIKSQVIRPTPGPGTTRARVKVGARGFSRMHALRLPDASEAVCRGLVAGGPSLL